MPIVALAGAIFLAALSLAILALVAAHYVHAKVQQMSLLDDFKTAFADIETAVKAAVAPVMSELEKVKTDLANALAELESKNSEVAGLMSELASFKDAIVAAVTPAA